MLRHRVGRADRFREVVVDYLTTPTPRTAEIVKFVVQRVEHTIAIASCHAPTSSAAEAEPLDLQCHRQRGGAQ
jgi:hypothetical protein